VPLRCQQELHIGVSTGNNPEDSNLAWSVEAMQLVPSTYPSVMIGVSENISYSTEHHHACTTFVLCLPVVHLPIALPDRVRGNLDRVCLQAEVAKHADLPTHTSMLNCCWCLHSTLSAVTHKVIGSGYMLIWTFFLILVCGTRAKICPHLSVAP
jgi:hypothetical protein